MRVSLRSVLEMKTEVMKCHKFIEGRERYDQCISILDSCPEPTDHVGPFQDDLIVQYITVGRNYEQMSVRRTCTTQWRGPHSRVSQTRWRLLAAFVLEKLPLHWYLPIYGTVLPNCHTGEYVSRGPETRTRGKKVTHFDLRLHLKASTLMVANSTVVASSPEVGAQFTVLAGT
jgi:hypothetical protein